MATTVNSGLQPNPVCQSLNLGKRHRRQGHLLEVVPPVLAELSNAFKQIGVGGRFCPAVLIVPVERRVSSSYSALTESQNLHPSLKKSFKVEE